MWGVSKDYDTIIAFRMSHSDDSGKHFSKPVTVATFDNKVDGQKVDIQERVDAGRASSQPAQRSCL